VSTIEILSWITDGCAWIFLVCQLWMLRSNWRSRKSLEGLKRSVEDAISEVLMYRPDGKP
jgi:hypothetical protein